MASSRPRPAPPLVFLPSEWASRDLFSGVFECLMETRLEHFQRRQFGEIFADTDGFSVELKKFNLFSI